MISLINKNMSLSSLQNINRPEAKLLPINSFSAFSVSVGTLTADVINSSALPSSTSIAYTPVLLAGGTNVGWVFTSSGQYQKVGSMVFFNASVTTITKGSSNGPVSITLPTGPGLLPLYNSYVTFYPGTNSSYAASSLFSAEIAPGIAAANIYTTTSSGGKIIFQSSTIVGVPNTNTMSGFYYVG